MVEFTKSVCKASSVGSYKTLPVIKPSHYILRSEIAVNSEIHDSNWPILPLTIVKSKHLSTF